MRARFLAETGYITAKVGADGAVFDDDGRVLLDPARRRRQVGTRRGVGRSERVARSRPSSASSPKSSASTVGVEQLVGTFFRPANVGLRTALVRLGRVPLLDRRAHDFRFQPHEVLEARGITSTRSPTGTSTTNSSRDSRATVGRAAPTSCTAERRRVSASSQPPAAASGSIDVDDNAFGDVRELAFAQPVDEVRRARRARGSAPPLRGDSTRRR